MPMACAQRGRRAGRGSSDRSPSPASWPTPEPLTCGAALPFAAACAGIAIYAVMDALMKGLGLTIGTYSAMVWRMAAAMIVTGVLYARTGAGWPGRTVVRVHAARSVVVTVMALCFFWGITRMPLAEAVALSFVAPLIALGLAALVLKERVGARAVSGSATGLAGVAVVLAGRLGGEHGAHAARGAAAVLIAAVFYAVNLVMARHQAQLARPVEIAFFQNGFVLALLLPATPVLLAVPATASQWGAVAAAAGLGVVSLLLMSWAYARVEAQRLLPMEYTAFVWAALMGWLMFDEPLTMATVAGTVLIVAGCLIAARQHGSPALPDSEAMA